MSEARVLLIGRGHIGQIHGNYLSAAGCDWKWFDTRSDLGSMSNFFEWKIDALSKFSHIIVATPTLSHAPILALILENAPQAKILVEKPGVILSEDLHLLQESNVYVSLPERFNPSVTALRTSLEQKEIIEISTVRNSAKWSARSPESAFFDTGIHDLDIIHRLLGDSVVSSQFSKSGDTFSLGMTFEREGIRANLLVSNDTAFKERSVTVRTTLGTYHCDLLRFALTYSVSLQGYRTESTEKVFERAEPIRDQLSAFLDNSLEDAHESHKLLLDLADLHSIPISRSSKGPN